MYLSTSEEHRMLYGQDSVLPFPQNRNELFVRMEKPTADQTSQKARSVFGASRRVSVWHVTQGRRHANLADCTIVARKSLSCNTKGRTSSKVWIVTFLVSMIPCLYETQLAITTVQESYFVGCLNTRLITVLFAAAFGKTIERFTMPFDLRARQNVCCASFATVRSARSSEYDNSQRWLIGLPT